MAVLRKALLEHDIKARIMDYLNIPENEYGLVFTMSRGFAFKLLAESYPFQTNKKLLTMFDYESQSVNWMVQSARDRKVQRFIVPGLSGQPSNCAQLI
ncbi:hypothetical protein ACFX1Q_027920 [Malus domestica]